MEEFKKKCSLKMLFQGYSSLNQIGYSINEDPWEDFSVRFVHQEKLFYTYPTGLFLSDGYHETVNGFSYRPERVGGPGSCARP